MHLLYGMSRNECRDVPACHALDYSIIRKAAADPTIHSVADSYVSVVPNEGLDRYKRKMGFTVEPHTVAIYFHPAIAGVMTSRVASRITGAARRFRPEKMGLDLAARIVEGARVTAGLI
jgi:hypothetical protein